ncbi:hypothetical protein A146_19755 [Vibrio splendidus FF-500]|nr:hypothetical protein A146_19755 [Vibrio splendidus FF-500]PMM99205.1 hypothetical protein BCT40_06420 [Vibrio lentus]
MVGLFVLFAIDIMVNAPPKLDDLTTWPVESFEILFGVYIEVSMLVLISLENDRFYDISEGAREKGE